MEPFKVEKIDGGRYEYRKIQAWQAKNWDGSPSGWQRGTEEGDRWLVEKRFIPNNGKPRYTNYW